MFTQHGHTLILGTPIEENHAVACALVGGDLGQAAVHIGQLRLQRLHIGKRRNGPVDNVHQLGAGIAQGDVHRQPGSEGFDLALHLRRVRRDGKASPLDAHDLRSGFNHRLAVFDGILHPLAGDVRFCLQHTLFGGQRQECGDGALQLVEIVAQLIGLRCVARRLVLGGLLL